MITKVFAIFFTRLPGASPTAKTRFSVTFAEYAVYPLANYFGSAYFYRIFNVKTTLSRSLKDLLFHPL